MQSSISRVGGLLPASSRALVRNLPPIESDTRSFSLKVQDLTGEKPKSYKSYMQVDKNPASELDFESQSKKDKIAGLRKILKTFDSDTVERYPGVKVVVAYLEKGNIEMAEKYMAILTRSMESKLHKSGNRIIDPNATGTPMEIAEKSLTQFLLSEDDLNPDEAAKFANEAASLFAGSEFNQLESKEEAANQNQVKTKLSSGTLSNMVNKKTKQVDDKSEKPYTRVPSQSVHPAEKMYHDARLKQYKQQQSVIEHIQNTVKSQIPSKGVQRTDPIFGMLKNVTNALDNVTNLTPKERSVFADHPFYGSIALMHVEDIARIRAEYNLDAVDDAYAFFSRFCGRTAEDLEHPITMSRFEYEDMMKDYDKRQEEIEKANEINDIDDPATKISQLNREIQQLRNMLSSSKGEEKGIVAQKLEKAMHQRNVMQGFTDDDGEHPNMDMEIDDLAKMKAEELAAKMSKEEDAEWMDDKIYSYRNQLRRNKRKSEYKLLVMSPEERLDLFFADIDAIKTKKEEQNKTLHLSKLISPEKLAGVIEVDFKPREKPPAIAAPVPTRMLLHDKLAEEADLEREKAISQFQTLSDMAAKIPLNEKGEVDPEVAEAVYNNIHAAKLEMAEAIARANAVREKLSDSDAQELIRVAQKAVLDKIDNAIEFAVGSTETPMPVSDELFSVTDRLEPKPESESLAQVPDSSADAVKTDSVKTAEVVSETVTSEENSGVVDINPRSSRRLFPNLKHKRTDGGFIKLAGSQVVKSATELPTAPPAGSFSNVSDLKSILDSAKLIISSDENTPPISDDDANTLYRIITDMHRKNGQDNNVQNLDDMKKDDPEAFKQIMTVIYHGGGESYVNKIRIVNRLEEAMEAGTLRSEREIATRLLNAGLPLQDAAQIASGMWFKYSHDHGLREDIDTLADADGQSLIIMDPTLGLDNKPEKSIYARNDKDFLLSALMKRKSRSRIFEGINEELDEEFGVDGGHDVTVPTKPNDLLNKKLTSIQEAVRQNEVSVDRYLLMPLPQDVLDNPENSKFDNYYTVKTGPAKSKFSFGVDFDKAVDEVEDETEESDQLVKIREQYHNLLHSAAKSINMHIEMFIHSLNEPRLMGGVMQQLPSDILREMSRLEYEVRKQEEADKLAMEKVKTHIRKKEKEDKEAEDKPRTVEEFKEKRKAYKKEIADVSREVLQTLNIEANEMYEELIEDIDGKGLTFASDVRDKAIADAEARGEKYVENIEKDIPFDMKKYQHSEPLSPFDAELLRAHEEQKESAKLANMVETKKKSTFNLDNIDMSTPTPSPEEQAEALALKKQEAEKAILAQRADDLSKEIGIDPETESQVDKLKRVINLKEREAFISGAKDEELGIGLDEDGEKVDMSYNELKKQRIEISKKESEKSFRELKKLEVMYDRQIRIFEVEKDLKTYGLPTIDELNTMKYKYQSIMTALQTPGAKEKNKNLMEDARDQMAKMVAVKRLKEDDPELHYWRLFLAKLPPSHHKKALNCHDMPIDPMKLFKEVDEDESMNLDECIAAVTYLIDQRYKDTKKLAAKVEKRANDPGLYFGNPLMTIRDLRKEQKAASKLMLVKREADDAKLTASQKMEKALNDEALAEFKLRMINKLEGKVSERELMEREREEMEWNYREKGRKGVRNVLTEDIDEDDLAPVGSESMMLHKKLLKRNKPSIADPDFHRRFLIGNANPFQVNEIVKQSLNKQKLKELKMLNPQYRAMERAKREQKKILQHLAHASTKTSYYDPEQMDLDDEVDVEEEFDEDALAVSSEVDSDLSAKTLLQNVDDLPDVDDDDDGGVILNHQRFVYARVVATFGHRVLVEQVGNTAYTKQAQFFVGDTIDTIMQTVGHENYQIDGEDNLQLIKSPNTATTESETREIPGVDKSIAAALTGNADDVAIDAAAVVRNQRRRWQCVKSRHMNLFCGDYVFIDPHPARAWNQSAVTSSKALNASGQNSDGIVRALFRRHNEVERGGRSVTNKNITEEALPLCANADHMIILTAAMGQPAFNPFLIDKYIAAARISNTKVTIVYNKVDLVDELMDLHSDNDIEELKLEEEQANKEFKKLSKKEQREQRRRLAKEEKKARKNNDIEYLAALREEAEEEAHNRKMRKKLRRKRSAGHDVDPSQYTTPTLEERLDWDDDEESETDNSLVIEKWMKRQDKIGHIDADAILQNYERLGYKVIYTSSKSGTGLDELREVIKRHHTSVLVGPSGVGKSSLLNALIPDLDIRTKEITLSGHGQHTTTNAALYHLDSGGQIIDTPGAQSFVPPSLEPEAVSILFPEIEETRHFCKLGSSCTHMTEPGCAVKEVLDAGIHNLMHFPVFDLFDERRLDDPHIVEFKRRLVDGELREAAQDPGMNPLLQYANVWYRDYDNGSIPDTDIVYQPHEFSERPLDLSFANRFDSLRDELDERDKSEFIEYYGEEAYEMLEEEFKQQDREIELALGHEEESPSLSKKNTKEQEQDKQQNDLRLMADDFISQEKAVNVVTEVDIDNDDFDGNFDFNYDITKMTQDLIDKNKISNEVIVSDSRLQAMIDQDALVTAQAMAQVDLEDKISVHERRIKEKREEEVNKIRAANLGISYERFKELQAKVREMDSRGEIVNSDLVPPEENVGLLSSLLVGERERLDRQNRNMKKRFKSNLPPNFHEKFFIPPTRYNSYLNLVNIMTETSKHRRYLNKKKTLTVREEAKLEENRKRFEHMEDKRYKKILERAEFGRHRSQGEIMLSEMKKIHDPHTETLHNDDEALDLHQQMIDVGANVGPTSTDKSTSTKTKKFVSSYYGPASVLQSNKDRDDRGFPTVQSDWDRMVDIRARSEEMMVAKLKVDINYEDFKYRQMTGKNLNKIRSNPEDGKHDDDYFNMVENSGEF